MSRDPIIEELHRHRQELFREFGNDSEAFVRYLQKRESESGRVVKAPEPAPPDSAARRTRNPFR